MEYAIEINNLSKKYHDFTLDKISFSIAKGTVVGLIGENGAGKSTLINSILGIIDANYSSLKYFGKEYKDNEKEIKEDLAVIFDTTHFNLEFTPKFIGLILEKTYKNWDNDIYCQYLKCFNLPLKKKLKYIFTWNENEIRICNCF